MDQLRQAFKRIGVTRETLAKNHIKQSLVILLPLTTLPKDVIVSYLKERFREYLEYPDKTPLFLVAKAFSESKRSETSFEVFLEETSKSLNLSKGTILLIRNEWDLKRLD